MNHTQRDHVTRSVQPVMNARQPFPSSPILMLIIVAAIVPVLAVTATACGSTGSAPLAVIAKPTPQFAEQIVLGLAANVPTLRPAEVFTAETDPNHMLGRPGGYTSKAAFTDTRVDPAKTHGSESIDRGGGVEVFSTARGAQQRGEYVQRVAQAVPLLGTWYAYRSGPVLLRLTGVLTPAQAQEYQSALARVTGTPAEAIEATS